MIWLDCDGVLANFSLGFKQEFGSSPEEFEDKHGSSYFWTRIRQTPHFFERLPLMSDARELYEAVKPLRPIILTGCPRGSWAELQKMRWRDRHFPGVPMVTCMSKQKKDYCRPGDVLIDDRDHFRELWEQAGGTFILHVSAKQSIIDLQTVIQSKEKIC